MSTNLLSLPLAARWKFILPLQGALLVSLLLTGCAENPRIAELSDNADVMAAQAGLQRTTITTDAFVITSFYRISRPDMPLNAYIEGDGFSWRSRTQLSTNPTPRKPLALATADPAPNVVYLAQPCQFTLQELNPQCTTKYWTSHRYAEEVIVAMNQAVTHYAKQLPLQRVNLIGYSGGDAIAALIAARRQDVASLRTVAGNLDMAELNRLHRVTPMPDSLNAIDVAPKLAGLAQIHYSGGDDKIVPVAIAQRFVEATTKRCAQLRYIPGLSHDGDWKRLWPGFLRETFPCSASLEQ